MLHFNFKRDLDFLAHLHCNMIFLCISPGIRLLLSHTHRFLHYFLETHPQKLYKYENEEKKEKPANFEEIKRNIFFFSCSSSLLLLTVVTKNKINQEFVLYLLIESILPENKAFWIFNQMQLYSTSVLFNQSWPYLLSILNFWFWLKKTIPKWSIKEMVCAWRWVFNSKKLF
jgi:hypothetical protein